MYVTLAAMTALRLAMPFILFGGFASADTCPQNREITQDLDVLIEDLQQAASEMEARRISNKMWELWLLAPDDAAQALLDEGIAKLGVSDHLGAENAFTKLVDYCPNFAEGYNQRAFSKFLRGDYSGALVDLDVAVALSPRHVGALSGRALSLFGLGDDAAGQLALREALSINPWLSERALLKEPPGKDL